MTGIRVNGTLISLRALQVYAIINGIIAVAGGGAFVWSGSDALASVVGAQYPAMLPQLQQAIAAIEPDARITFDTWFRALGWYWLVTGLMLFWITPKIQHRSDWFRFIHIGFMAVGIASLLTIAENGTNIHNRYGAVAIELGVPFVAMFWQWTVAGQARRSNTSTAMISSVEAGEELSE